MKDLTFLDYSTESTGKNIEAKLSDIALLKEAILDMQQLLKNPEKLPEISQAAKPEILR